MALLEVKNLNINVDVPGGTKSLVRGVGFYVEKGEVLGIVGPSGSGKSLTSMAVARILNDGYRISSDGILFDGKRLDLMSEKELQEIRGKDIAYIFQEPMTSLNPILTIEKQVEEPLRIHRIEFSTKVERKRAVITALKDAGLDPTKELLGSYPHELSGGMRQRVMIAMAFICKPQLIVADEITTALDVVTRDGIMELLSEYVKRYKTSVLFISHDRKLVRSISDRIVYMDKGEILENQGFEKVFRDSSGDISMPARTIVPKCGKVILSVRNLSFSYVDKSIFGKEIIKPVLKNVTLDLYEGETLGVVGKSGSGKSTLMKVISGLQMSYTGSIWFEKGFDNPQMVFQDPYGSLNPSKTVGRILAESVRLGEKRERRAGRPVKKMKRSEIARLIFDMLASVDLNSEIAYRYLSGLSGGQRQRVAIACALIMRPGIVILDEPVSAVDADVRDMIIGLLQRLRTKFGCSYIFISHDPEVIAKTCDRVLVLEDGTIKE